MDNPFVWSGWYQPEPNGLYPNLPFSRRLYNAQPGSKTLPLAVCILVDIMDDDNPESARGAWKHRGQVRPAEAIAPGPGQESVWDYPRPPVIMDDVRLVQIRLNDVLIAESRASRRVLETASPPTFYLPPESMQVNCLRAETHSSFCEWKGRATYFSVCLGGQCSEHAAWAYPEPLHEFAAIRNYLAFYPDRLECYVDGERVRAQAGGFYGGWITDGIVGPFKGEPGTSGW